MMGLKHWVLLGGVCAGLRLLTAAEPTVLTNVAASAPKATDWPQWRGVNRDDRSTETGLLQQWPANGPKLLWTNRDAGIGFSGFAVVGDTLYTMGADNGQEIILAINVQDGKKRWSTPFSPVLSNGWGDGPRSSPTFDYETGNLYALSGTGELACIAAADGKKKWSKSMTKDFGGKTPNWGYCESPLIDGAKVVVTPGMSNCVAALDKETGAVIWTSNGVDDAAQYSSIVKAAFGGVPAYLTMTKGGLIAVAAKDGKFLWRYEKTQNGTAVIPTPIVEGDFVYSTSGYGTGCGLVQVSGNDAKEVYFNKEMKNHHGGVILKDGHVYGYSDGQGWLCQDFKTGKVVWSERKALDKGCLTYADGHFYCLGEGTSTVVLIEASTAGFKEVGRFKLPEATAHDRKKGKVWTHPVIAGGKLYLRDQELVFCYDIKK